MSVISLLPMVTEGHDLCLMRIWADSKATEVGVSVLHDVLTISVKGVRSDHSFLSRPLMALQLVCLEPCETSSCL